MTTQHELTEREREISRLEDEIIAAWVAGGGKFPQTAFAALLSGAKAACYPGFSSDRAADMALDRLRRVAALVRS
jgi:hypothetical protein